MNQNPNPGGKIFGTKKSQLDQAKIFQVIFLCCLILVGITFKDFSLKPIQILMAIASGLGVHYFFKYIFSIEQLTPTSSLTTCLGTCMLLRSDKLWIHPLAIALALSSKFLIRVDKKHIFNPATFGVVLAFVLFPSTWISPGQWGREIFIIVLIVAFGLWVSKQAKTLDVAFYFLFIYASLLGLRTFYLHNPITLWLHHVSQGSLLVFSFFMLSDPATVPKQTKQKILFAVTVAALSFYIQFFMFKPNGPMLSLFFVHGIMLLIQLLKKCHPRIRKMTKCHA